MKKITYISIIFSAVLFLSCERDLETEDVSTVTYFANFDLEGGDFIVVDQGSTFEEPGIEVTENGEAIEFERESNVNTGAPGFYQVAYSATNSDGYASTVVRTVVVQEPGAPDLDLAGDWTSNTNAFGGESLGQTMEVEKLAPGVYAASDSYAHPSLDIAVRFSTLADGTAALEHYNSSPFGTPMDALISFDVSSGQSIPQVGGGTVSCPVDCDMAMAIYLGGSADFQTLKTWLKDEE